MDRAKPFDIPKREVWEAYKTLAARFSACGHRNGWRYDRRGRGAAGNFLVE
jgi:hypothetical protein